MAEPIEALKTIGTVAKSRLRLTTNKHLTKPNPDLTTRKVLAESRCQLKPKKPLAESSVSLKPILRMTGAYALLGNQRNDG